MQSLMFLTCLFSKVKKEKPLVNEGLSLELLHLYTTHSRGEMEVIDILTLKLRVKRGIS